MTLDVGSGHTPSITHGKSKLRWVVAFPFPCPHCRKEHLKIFADIEHNPTFICLPEDSGCGRLVDTRAGEFLLYKGEIAHALDAMGPRYHKL